MSSYGMTLQDYDARLQAQQHACAICGVSHLDVVKRLNVDHDHTTGRIRGLLCHKCNRALGLVRDRVSVLQKMIAYLEQDPSGNAPGGEAAAHDLG